jgi:hypothetical protein
MKTFEKPVVVLNEMLMNESIAAACCFATVNGVDKVLSGGSILAKGDYKQYWLDGSILDLFGGHPPLAGAHYDVSYYAICAGDYDAAAGSGTTNCKHTKPTEHRVNTSLVLDSSLGTWVLESGKAVKIPVGLNAAGKWVTSATNMVSPMVGYKDLILTSAHCDHGDKTCPWVSSWTSDTPYHTGSTGTHLFAGTAWNQPHSAVQYNS